MAHIIGSYHIVHIIWLIRYGLNITAMDSIYLLYPAIDKTNVRECNFTVMAYFFLLRWLFEKAFCINHFKPTKDMVTCGNEIVQNFLFGRNSKVEHQCPPSCESFDFSVNSAMVRLCCHQVVVWIMVWKFSFSIVIEIKMHWRLSNEDNYYHPIQPFLYSSWSWRRVKSSSISKSNLIHW